MALPRTVHLQPRPTSVRAARRLVGDTLDDAGVPDERAEAIRLVVSELVTNAVVHGDGDVELSLDLDGRCVRVAVADEGGDGAPSASEIDPGAVSGRGLHLVEQMADRWGTAPRRDGRPGKTVWAELRF